MKHPLLAVTAILLTTFLVFSFTNDDGKNAYQKNYQHHVTVLNNSFADLLHQAEVVSAFTASDKALLLTGIHEVRKQLKAADFWLRYLNPNQQKKLNGPLPVEWETEVFEKFEKPYRRPGAGLTLAENYLDEEVVSKDTLMQLLQVAVLAMPSFMADSVTKHLSSPSHFYLANRLFLLNLASIYTTGFECPDTSLIIPELHEMMEEVNGIYLAFNESFPATPLTQEYFSLYHSSVKFVEKQSSKYSHFDHFAFIQQYVNPLFVLNQKFIRNYQVSSRSYVDFSLNPAATSIFDKSLYLGQNPKGIFLRVNDPEALAVLDKAGKLLFYDPILSGNNQRSCVSCHKPEEFFTDTLSRSSLQFDHQTPLPRNTPSLLNVKYHHLIMMDGKHISLQEQTKAVITNPNEMGSNEEEVLRKVLSCKEYKQLFTALLKYTPQEKAITFEHITSAITFYYSKFSDYQSPFDEAMNQTASVESSVKQGFNLFMSKTQCATCHFVPQFNGVKPPFTSSEFEVIGVPQESDHLSLSKDAGRHTVHQAEEMANAFRTGTLRNAANSMPYMHNGVFKTLEEVVDFYDAGGGQGKGLQVPNQTLSASPLGLSAFEKKQLIAFIASLTEKVGREKAPQKLPESKLASCRERKVGGEY